MANEAIKKLVIVGGGTAGWISAALMAKVLGKTLSITLVESDDISTVGVGEASIPPIIALNNALGISEAAFLKACKGTFKLGIEFENWGHIGNKYMHAFGGVGKNFPFCDFHHFWIKSQQMGLDSQFGDFSLNYTAAKLNKFGKLPQLDGTHIPGIEYAYHFDAGLYAQFLRKYSEALGVTRIEGKINKVILHPENGSVTNLHLENGSEITGDFFIDCSGQRALLIEQALHTGFDDWSHYLPCDSAIAVPSKKLNHEHENTQSDIAPYTRSIAHEAGWQWRIPLQHRMGNGIVYSSRYMSDDKAEESLLTSIKSEALAEPKLIRFRTGRRRQTWNKNVVAIGLSGGFFEPLESTNIHMIQTALIRLIKCFPHQDIKASEVEEFNRQSETEALRIRDFIILHYKQSTRTDSEFWRHCQQMRIPKSLQQKMALFESSSKVFREQDELFTEVAWQQVMIGQGVIPKDYHPIVSSLSEQQMRDLMDNLKTLISRSADKLDSHQQYLKQYE